jgi:hypothetical protein
MRIHFPTGVVAVLSVDESIHFAAPFIPTDAELTADDSTPTPWPAWISDVNYRRPHYSSYAEEIYSSVVSYYIHGDDVVVLLDINGVDPEITVEHFPASSPDSL